MEIAATAVMLACHESALNLVHWMTSPRTRLGIVPKSILYTSRWMTVCLLGGAALTTVSSKRLIGPWYTKSYNGYWMIFCYLIGLHITESFICLQTGIIFPIVQSSHADSMSRINIKIDINIYIHEEVLF